MSKAWENGSTPAWRKIRLDVLIRDGYQCQLRLDGCTGRADQVHHTLGRAVTGDNPEFLVAACRTCNLKVGDPTRQPDPAPRPAARW